MDSSAKKLLVSFLVSLIAFLLVCFSSEQASARVFNINDETISSYFKGTGSMHVLKDRAIDGLGTAEVEQISESKYLYGGEVGFALHAQSASLRLGVEYLKTLPTTAKGEDESGTHLYDIESGLTSMIPKVGIDLHVKQWKQSRVILGFDYGQAKVSLTNQVVLTSDGQASFGVTDFIEIGEVSATVVEARLGFEHLLTDTTTFLVDIGYRQLSTKVAPKATSSYTGFHGDVSKGSELLDESGNSRTFNLNGVTLGITFRFYL